ncbi:MAG: Gfo/Idh/MocA family oxidoreductase [Bryobacteraceae bacterium]
MSEPSLTRRALVAAAAAATVTAQNRIRIAFLGASHSHGPDKVRICKDSPDWELAGVWERDPKAAAEYKAKGVTLLERDKILEDRSIPVVAIESEVKPHEELALMALEAGKHLHLEKPPSDNPEGLRKIVRAARDKKLMVQIGYMWRHHPGMNAIIEAGRKGWLGDIFLVRGMMNTLITDRRWEWALFSGGQMFEQGCHLIDPMVRLMGRPHRVSSHLRHHGRYNDNLADNTAAIFDWPGAMGVITSTLLQNNGGAHRMFEVEGSNGTAVLRPIEGPPRLEFDLVKAAGPYPSGRHEVPLAKFERYTGDFAELAGCVRSGESLSVTLDQDLDVQEALLRASGMWT